MCHFGYKFDILLHVIQNLLFNKDVSCTISSIVNLGHSTLAEINNAVVILKFNQANKLGAACKGLRT